MAYTYIDLGTLSTRLQDRLDQGTGFFWTSTERTILLNEALRAYGLFSAFWRDRGTITTPFGIFPFGTPYIDLTDPATGLVNSDGVFLLASTVTDWNIIQAIQYHFLEATSSQAVWNGTEMFTLNNLRYAIQRTVSQFLSETGIVISPLLQAFIADSTGRVPIPDTVMDVRRATWIDGSSVYHPLWREDEMSLTASDPLNWKGPGIPSSYSIMTPPPLTVQLAPFPSASGTLDLMVTNAGPDFDPSISPTVIPIPDDLTPAIKWGVMADLLSMDGPAYDPARADYCYQRYQQYVQYARVMPVVLYAEIEGTPVIPCTLQEMDASTPNWENITSISPVPPTEIVIISPNLIATSPVADDAYTITLDVVRKTPVLGASSVATFVQIGREQVEAILDYAEHLALFKVGGAEWMATKAQADNFMRQALTYNQRISAAARYLVAPKEFSQREKQERPRRLKDADGLGTVSSKT